MKTLVTLLPQVAKRFTRIESKIQYRFGGDNEIRTHDPLLARQVLSQLSYTPTISPVVDGRSYRMRNIPHLQRIASCTGVSPHRFLSADLPTEFFSFQRPSALSSKWTFKSRQ
jgi:hypothetical protein